MSSNPGQVCARCRGGEAKLFLVKGSKVCKQCLVCQKCSKSLLPPASIILHSGGSFYCEEDYESHFGIKCHKCQLPIKHGTKLLATSKSCHWHPECLTCGECGKLLSGKFQLDKDGHTPLCTDDYVKRNGPKCNCCKKAMQKWVIANDLCLCNSCFKLSSPCLCCRAVITPELTNVKSDPVSGGGGGGGNNLRAIHRICATCASTGVVSDDEASLLLEEVKRVLVESGLLFFSSRGIADNLKIKLLSEREMEAYQKKFPSLAHGKCPLGFTLTEQQSIRIKQQQPIGSSLYEDVEFPDLTSAMQSVMKDVSSSPSSFSTSSSSTTSTRTTSSTRVSRPILSSNKKVSVSRAAAGGGGGGGGGGGTHLPNVEKRRQSESNQKVPKEDKDKHYKHNEGKLRNNTTNLAQPRTAHAFQHVISHTKTSKVHSVSKIGVLTSIPRSLCGAVIAHELGHAFLTLEHFNLNNSSQLYIIEGICELFAFIWLSHVHSRYCELSSQNTSAVTSSSITAATTTNAVTGSREIGSDADMFLKLQQSNKDEVYGQGFRLILKSYKDSGLSLVDYLQYIQQKGDLPKSKMQTKSNA
jgi:hypothetical protein